MEKRIQASLLLSFYGSLLTGRQRQLLRCYYDDDLSLSEIAELYGMTRQAAHDAIKRGESQLAQWEEKLNLRARWSRVCEQLTVCQAHLSNGDIARAKQTIRTLLEEEQADRLD